MMKSIAFAAALAIIPASAYAQSYGPIIRDPAGGSMRDPALVDYGWYGGAYATPADPYRQNYGPIIRDPAGGSMRDPALAGYGWYRGAYGTDGAIDNSPRVRVYVMEQPAAGYRYGQPVAAGTVLPRGNVGYREVPIEYGAQGYRSTTVTDDVVIIVQPRSRRVIRTID
jgi:hypothetical protein